VTYLPHIIQVGSRHFITHIPLSYLEYMGCEVLILLCTVVDLPRPVNVVNSDSHGPG
jgi:hypothetical protein